MKRIAAAKYVGVPLTSFDLAVDLGKLTPDSNGNFSQSDLDAYKATLNAPQATGTALSLRPIALPVALNNAPQMAGEREGKPRLPFVPIHHRLTLSIDEAAAFAGVSRSAVLRAIAAGELPVFTGVARGRRVRRGDVVKWVDGWK